MAGGTFERRTSDFRTTACGGPGSDAKHVAPKDELLAWDMLGWVCDARWQNTTKIYASQVCLIHFI